MATGLHPNNHGLVNNSFYDSTMQTVPYVRMAGFDTQDVAEDIPADLKHRYKPVDGSTWAAS
jgi:predicted AlkP superfamily pyrophosphatase or phosphodiesterase